MLMVGVHVFRLGQAAGGRREEGRDGATCKRLGLALAVLVAGGLSACASTSTAPQAQFAAGRSERAFGGDPGQALIRGRDALVAGDLDKALTDFADAAARNPTDPSRQTLVALVKEMQAQGDPEAIDVAMAGYEVALRQSGEGFWPAALAGRAAFDRGRYDQAQNFFARAVLERPSDARAMYGLALSAYRAGDLTTAALAAERSADLGAGGDEKAGGLRLAALSHAANGDAAQMQRVRALYVAQQEPDPVFDDRLQSLVQTSDLNQPAFVAEALDSAAPDQVSVDVAIILSQNSRRDALGMNLLDGLRLQYGASANSSKTDTDGVNTSPHTRTITEAPGSSTSRQRRSCSGGKRHSNSPVGSEK
ncbi:hypothetical protein LTR94_024751, partial [Friedmanniomyces endolithicus]